MGRCQDLGEQRPVAPEQPFDANKIEVVLRSQRCSAVPRVGVPVRLKQRNVLRAGARTGAGQSRTAASTASRATTRYVVYFPPATSVIPGTGVTTACSCESLLVASDSPASNGLSPAYTPTMSSVVSGRTRMRLTCSSK